MLVYLNGEIIEATKAKAGILEPGFLYGQGLFETIRSYNREIPFLDQHLKRLAFCAKIINLKVPAAAKLKQAVCAASKANNIPNSYIRLNVWKGNRKTNTAVIVKRLAVYKQDVYEKGFKGIIVDVRQNEFSPLARVKSLNYLLFILARQEAARKGGDEAILLNTSGYLAEGSRSNIFLVRDKKILTPSLDCGCLAGITRKIVIKLARKQWLKVYERKIRPEELFRADEAFLTNSLIEIMPLTSINKIKIGSGTKGEVTTILLNRYRDMVFY